jgi:hypothetical protein
MDTSDHLNRLRVFNLASQELMPLVDEMHSNAYTKLLQEFRTGTPDLLPFVARCEAIQGLIEEIQAKSTQYQNQLAREKE